MTLAINNTHWPKYALLAAGPILYALVSVLSASYWDPKIVTTVAVSAWIVLWWVTEVIPLAVTSLLPLVLFPAFGILDLNVTAANYANPTVFLFMAGFIFALAMEKHHLHTRIALHTVKLIGVDSDRIVLGFMVSTGFISLWINNTAAVLLMLPIATSVLKLLEEEMEEGAYKKLSVSLMLSLTYSAVIGGMGTIIGSPTNIVMVGYMKEMYGIEVSFLQWFLLCFPVAFVMIWVAYLILVKVFFRIPKQSFPSASRLLDDKLALLGTMTYQEYAVSIAFGFTALGWIFRDLIVQWYDIPFLNDTIVGMSGALLLFLIPDRSSKTGFLLDWKSIEQLAWGILLLLGGGLALAKALENSGVIKLIGLAIASSGSTDYVFLLITVVLTLTFLTQFIGNTALNTIALPMVFGIANSAHIDPILLGLPATFAVSFSYTLPMSTAPNAVVFVGEVKIKDMVKAGIPLSLLGVLLVIVSYSIYYSFR